VLTPSGWFRSVMKAARHHGISEYFARRLLREGQQGWRYVEFDPARGYEALRAPLPAKDPP
jgi:hypothetical protein